MAPLISGAKQLKRPRVVVVGGSFAGLCTARHLKSSCDVVLIEPRDYFEYTPGACHLLTGSNSFTDLLSPMSQVAAGFEHQCGWFAGLKPKSRVVIVRTPDGSKDKEIEFDALVLCNGQPYDAPIRASPAASSYSMRIKELQDFKRHVDTCKHIVVLGGGLVGVELAAEFATRLGHKPKISLISRGDLLNTLPPAAGKHASRWLARHNIDVFVGDEVKVHSAQQQTLTTKRGNSLSVDLLMDCTGSGKPFLVPSASSGVSRGPVTRSTGINGIKGDDEVLWPYSTSGLVTVDTSLQATDLPLGGVFAAGDVVEHRDGVGFALSSAKGGLFGTLSKKPTIRNAHLAESQAELAAENVRRFLFLKSPSQGTTTPQYLHYPADVFGAKLNPLVACVSLGPRNAIVIFNGFVMGGAILGAVAAIVKFVVERTKVSEIRQQYVGRAFWAFGHVVVNFIHCIHTSLVRLFSWRSVREPAWV